MNLTQGDLRGSIEFLRELNADWERDLLERKPKKIKCNEYHLLSLQKIFEDSSIQKPIVQATPELDCGFLESSVKKLSESVEEEESETRDTNQQPAIMTSCSKDNEMLDKQEIFKSQDDKNDEEKPWFGAPMYNRPLFRDSSEKKEAPGVDSNLQADHLDHQRCKSMQGDLFPTFMSANKISAVDRYSSLKSSSIKKKTQNNDDSKACIICTSSFT